MSKTLMSHVLHKIPFPCAVYFRKQKTNSYVFSHTCIRFLEKELPPSLSVDDILVSRCNPWLPRALRSPVIVLVSGDIARVISADTKTTQGVGGGTFLFVGSEFDRNRHPGILHESDLESGFFKIVFYSSVTVFSQSPRDCVWRPSDTAPVESCLTILPRVLAESQLLWFAKQFEANIRKSAEDSTWVVERGNSVDVYCERGLFPRWLVKLQRTRRREEAEAQNTTGPSPKRQRLETSRK